MDTDQLEYDMNELCHEWMHGKAPTDGVFGPVQAAARVFIFQALSAWTVLEANPDRAAGARLRELAAQDPRRRDPVRAKDLQREGFDPEALTAQPRTLRRHGLAPGRRSLRSSGRPAMAAGREPH